MRNRNLQIIALAALLCAAGVIVFFGRPGKKRIFPPTPAQIAQVERLKADAVFKKPEAKTAYKDFIAKYQASPDKHVQDEVGAARIRLAYVASRGGHFDEARKLFKEAATKDKGTGTMASDFGGIKDEALYQAAACLNAQGKKAEYRDALIDFIKTQPMSPLVNAAYKRIVMLDGRAKPEVVALLQSALDQQEKQIRFEMSVCGPKAAAYFLKLTGKGDFDYKTLAKECGTTDDGTTVQGLRKVLARHGLRYFGFEVARADLPKIATPAVLFLSNHYLVVTRVQGQQLTVYDPMTQSERQLDFSKIKDDQLTLIFLLTSAPGSEANKQ
ncbi:MAG TPA: cysteine peptidase family C39 domain-containing protein [Fimbriimonadaceae bacterium]|nr:cysteine peptidase family C39 domain-containing protein [Fimbriimonadaceae bacterium]